jgi:hypothetical protein
VVVAIFVGFEFGDSGVAFATHFAVEVAAQLAGAFGLGCGLGWMDAKGGRGGVPARWAGRLIAAYMLTI